MPSPKIQVWQGNACLFMMYSYSQGEQLMARTTPTPDVVDNDEDHCAGPMQMLPQKMRRLRGQPPPEALTSPATDRKLAKAEAFGGSARITGMTDSSSDGQLIG
jgi:hypothetical protein